MSDHKLVNIEGHRCFACNCGAVCWMLLMNGDIQCKNCGAILNSCWWDKTLNNKWQRVKLALRGDRS